MPPSKKFVILFLLMILSLIIFLHSRGALGWLDRAGWILLSGASERGYLLAHEPGEAPFAEESSLASTTAAVRLAQLEEENTELRRQMNFFATSTYRHVGADVIGRSLQPVGTSLFINRGARDGIAERNPVVAAHGVLVGTIARVDERTSLVRLLTDDQSKVAATLVNKDKSLGLIEGGYDISVRMNFIPQNEAVRVGDHVVTSGLEDNMPRGLLIGDVAAVVKEAYQPFQYAIVNPAVSLTHLTEVSVIIERPLLP